MFHESFHPKFLNHKQPFLRNTQTTRYPSNMKTYRVPPILSFALSFPAPTSTKSKRALVLLKPRTKSSSKEYSLIIPALTQSSLNPLTFANILVIILGEVMLGKLLATKLSRAVHNWFAAFCPPCSPCCMNSSRNIIPLPSRRTITKGSRSYAQKGKKESAKRNLSSNTPKTWSANSP